MGQHGSARSSVHSRLTIARRVIEEGWTVVAAARAADVSRQTASKWVGRFLAEGPDGLRDRSTRPHTIPRRVTEALVARIVELRMLRMGPHRIAWALHVARSTVYAVLCRLGLSHLRRLEPRPQVRRYEWPAPGDMVHLDTKKLGRIHGAGKRFGPRSHRNRGIGWSYAHVAIDDHSRLAYVEELPDEHPATTVGFVQRALAFYGSHGIEVRRILTDNGGNYRSKLFRDALAQRTIAERKTEPYHPQTNGKAEAMVKILINSWAYARPYSSTAERKAALPGFIEFYNHHRPHGGMDGARPIDRVRR